ncbi:hypothetical protein EVAR_41320_1 [Eumeta japonica]|uniref:Uncharacterized protein n=1 Tax=Eumeta variegata TaxID=151549 RepID=A0A4C1X566_EUMVA|nr:hypothetical protein EVAR_41320_1 [Eumeta japonica]
MAVTTSPTYHGSPIHDGFATIRRSRIRFRNLVEPNYNLNYPQRHSEYFTLQRPTNNSFLDNNFIVQYVPEKNAQNDSSEKPRTGILPEPLYAKLALPHASGSACTKCADGCQEIHYDSIDIKPRRRLRSLDFKEQARRSEEKSGSGEFNNGHRQAYDSHVLNQDGSEQHSGPAEAAATDCRRSHSDNCSETSSYLTDNDRPISSYSDNSTIPSTDTEDVLKELPSKSKFHRSPQKYATLNLRRPKSIDLKPPKLAENPFYSSLQRNRIGYHSEPNTPAGDKLFILNDEPNPLTEVQQIPRMPLQNRNGFRRSISETNGFTKRLNYRHSFSADTRTMPIIRRPHKCCECITGVPADGEKRPGNNRLSSRTLGTLYESQDPKVGCQTILRSKPPVPWWELAIKKSRYKSCPILEEFPSLYARGRCKFLSEFGINPYIEGENILRESDMACRTSASFGVGTGTAPSWKFPRLAALVGREIDRFCINRFVVSIKRINFRVCYIFYGAAAARWLKERRFPTVRCLDSIPTTCQSTNKLT